MEDYQLLMYCGPVEPRTIEICSAEERNKTLGLKSKNWITKIHRLF